MRYIQSVLKVYLILAVLFILAGLIVTPLVLFDYFISNSVLLIVFKVLYILLGTGLLGASVMVDMDD